MIIPYVQSLLTRSDHISAAWLTGSYGRGDQDEYSDFDFCACARDGCDVGGVFDALHHEVKNNPDIIFVKTLPHSRTLNAITDKWQRIDITLIESPQLGVVNLNDIRFLFGQQNVEQFMGQGKKFDPDSNKNDIENIIDEFIRILGLLYVVVGRQDYVLGQSGTQLLRDLLIKLLAQENADGSVRGVLSMKKSLSQEQYDLLQKIPPLAADKESVLNAHRHIAALFFERGKRLYLSKGIGWPDKFADVTQRMLETKIGLKIVAKT